MKSSFLIVVLFAFGVCSESWGQSSPRRRTQAPTSPRSATNPQKKKKVTIPARPVPRTQRTQSIPKPKPRITTKEAVSKTKTMAEKTHFEKFYDRLSISYFGVFTSPPLQDFNMGHSSLPRDLIGKDRPRDKTAGANIWSQFNFQYNFGWKMKFVVLPRWMTFLAPSSAKEGTTQVFGIEDALVGFAGVVYTSPDKKFNYWVRPGIRLPTSPGTRNTDRNKPGDEFGDLTHQWEALHAFTYDLDKLNQVGLYMQNRLWVYEDRYNDSHLRHYFAPFISHALSDRVKAQLYYEMFIENSRRRPSINNKPAVYKDLWQSAMIAFPTDITPKLNVMPYLSAYVNDPKFSMESFWIGAWIAYTIK